MIGFAGRRLMEDSYTWESRLSGLDRIMASGHSHAEYAPDPAYFTPRQAVANVLTGYARERLDL
jgi:hypothetical protein